jgi:hypothetical protein
MFGAKLEGAWMKNLLVKGLALLICIASLLMLFGVIGCTQHPGRPGCFNRPPTDFVDKAKETTDEIIQGVEEGKQKLDEIKDSLPTDEKPAETPDEPEPEVTPQPTEDVCPLEGKWKLMVKGDPNEFTNKDGSYYACEPFEIMFQVSDWQIEKMHSPRYGYMSPDYNGPAKITFNRANTYLEITMQQGNIRDEFNGYIFEDGGGGGGWESYLILDGKEHEDCWGSWEAVRTGPLSE